MIASMCHPTEYAQFLANIENRTIHPRMQNQKYRHHKHNYGISKNLQTQQTNKKKNSCVFETNTKKKINKKPASKKKKKKTNQADDAFKP